MKNLILLNLYMNLEYKDKYLKYKKKYFQLKQQIGGSSLAVETEEERLERVRQQNLEAERVAKENRDLSAILATEAAKQPQVEPKRRPQYQEQEPTRTFASVVRTHSDNTESQQINRPSSSTVNPLEVISVEQLENREPTEFSKIKDKKTIYVYNKISGFTVGIDLHSKDNPTSANGFKRTVGSGSKKTRTKEGIKRDIPLKFQKNLLEAANYRNPRITLNIKKLNKKGKHVTLLEPRHEYKLFTYNKYVFIYEVKVKNKSIKAKYINYDIGNSVLTVQPLKEIEGKIIDEPLTEYILLDESSTQFNSKRQLQLDTTKMDIDWRIIGYLDSEAKPAAAKPAAAKPEEAVAKPAAYEELVTKIKNIFGFEMGGGIIEELNKNELTNLDNNLSNAELVIDYVVSSLRRNSIDPKDKDKYNVHKKYIQKGIKKLENAKEQRKEVTKENEERKEFIKELKTGYTIVGKDLFQKGEDENKITHVALYSKLTRDYSTLLKIEATSDNFEEVAYPKSKMPDGKTDKTGELYFYTSQGKNLKVKYGISNIRHHVRLFLPLWLGNGVKRSSVENQSPTPPILFKYVKARDVDNYKHKRSLYYDMTEIKKKMKKTNQEKIDSLLDLLKRDGFYDRFIDISLSLKEICLKIKSKKLEELKEDIINYFEKELPGFLWDKDWENDISLISSNLHILHKIDSLEAPTELKDKIKEFLKKEYNKSLEKRVESHKRAKGERKQKQREIKAHKAQKEADSIQRQIGRKQFIIERMRKNYADSPEHLNIINEFEAGHIEERQLRKNLEEITNNIGIQNGGAATVPTPLTTHDKLISDQTYHQKQKKKFSELYSGVALNKDSINEDDMISFIGEVKKILKGKYETYINLLVDNNLLRQPTDHELRIGGVEIYQGPNRYVSSLVKKWIEYTIVKDFKEYVNSIDLEKLCEDIIESETYSPENLSEIFDATKNQHDKLLNNDTRYADNISKLSKVFARFKLNDDMIEFLREVRNILNNDEERVKDYIELLKSSKLIKQTYDEIIIAATGDRANTALTPISRSSSSSSSDSSNQYSTLSVNHEGSINSKYKVKLIKL